jgi:type II secretory pathway predicted ATPase ExeA
LCVVFAGDARLPERFRHADLQPIGSRIRRRLNFEAAEREELLACLDHLLDAAGNPSLMTSELKTTLAEHSAGNNRIMTKLADELLAAAIERNQAQLDEKLYLEVFAPPPPKKAARKK